MLFSTNIFIYVFLPLCTGVYFICMKLFKEKRAVLNTVLLAFSMAFYFVGGGIHVLILLTSILANYIFALIIASSACENNRRKKKVLFGLSIAVNIGLLIWFKYFNFISGNIVGLINLAGGKAYENPFSIALPIGISFFTFQAMSYVADVYCGKVPVQKSFGKLALYISFFPQLIAGPIVRYTEVADDIDHRQEDMNDFYDGLCRFIVGLSKKVLIADVLARPVNKIFALADNELTAALSWSGAFLFTLEIYFDFAGYSDMAIGMARMFGFHFHENFRMPYISQNVTEFWRRWHISLSSFFRDYVYIPLGGNRRGPLCTYRNLGIVFVLCGIWHGASWTFLLWGIYHGVFLIIERVIKNKWNFAMKGIAGNVITFFIVLFGWVLFQCDTIMEAFHYFRAMFGMNQLAEHLYYKYTYYINKEILFAAAAGFLLSIFPFERIKQKIGASPWKGFFCIFLLVLCMIYMSDASFNAFIYFQF